VSDSAARFGRRGVLLLGLATLACDQATKHVARAQLLGAPPRSYLGGTLRVEYVENAGAFLGLGSGLPSWARSVVFIAGTAGLLLWTAWVGRKASWSAAQWTGLGLLWAGGISNLVDRARYGAVPDFLNVGVGHLRTGIFNVADVAILAGVLLVALAGPRPVRS